MSQVAIECLIKDYHIMIAGEVTSKHEPNFDALVKGVLNNIGINHMQVYTVKHEGSLFDI